ncbi:MAG: CBS domain-containing protein [Hyphomicrobiaceae bacterium]|jgi:CBS domain-containing protein|nr:CBS domain-containing protein [Hyphomicrobiaceae bacterium]
MKKASSKVADVLEQKGDSVSTIQPTDTIATLSRRLRDEQVGALIVSADGRSVDGIISERDVAYALATHLGELHSMPVSALMTKTVISCAPTDKISDAAKVLRENRIRHLPVTDGKTLLGVIGMRDILIQRLDDIRHSTKKVTHLVNTNA